MPDTLTALAIVVLFFLPGYVAASVFFRNSPYARPGDIQFVLQIALWAAVVHVLAYPLTAPLIQVWRSDPFLTNETGRFLAWFIAVVLIEPVILGVALGQLLRAGQVQTFLSNFGMSFTDQSPTAWDVAFGPGAPGTWVKVRVREVTGSITLAGKLGESSAVGVSPHPHDLYLEELWELDANGLFLRKKPASAGVWIPGDRIDYVELYRT